MIESSERFRWDWLLILILAVAGALRLHSAATASQTSDEFETYIPSATRISWDHLPIRETQHAALVAYFIKASSLIFGGSPLGFRLLSVLAGVATIALLYEIAAWRWGCGPARWTALLLAVNRYHVTISARAFDLAFDLLFVALSMYAFARFLKSDRAKWLYVAALAAGLGFLCKELTCLMLPVFLGTLLLLPQRRWLRRKEPWLAAALFFAVILPDVWYTLATPLEGQGAFYANYGDHFSRFAGIGLSPHPWFFYFGRAVETMGWPYENAFAEIPTMRLVSALAIWTGVLVCTFRAPKDSLSVFLLVMFWGVFVFFALLGTREPSRQDVLLDPALWYWVDRTMLPGALLTGTVLAEYGGRLVRRLLG